MEHPNDFDNVVTTWRALSGGSFAEGKRILPVRSFDGFRILSGINHPTMTESLIFEFPDEVNKCGSNLQDSKGFSVSEEIHRVAGDEKLWISFDREADADKELYFFVAKDLFETIAFAGPYSASQAYGLLIERIKSWQEFMRTGRRGLSHEEEVGLFGELFFVKILMCTEIENQSVVNSWLGPLKSNHDFDCGSVSVEIKTTSADEGFTAKIRSLEQLDGSKCELLFLVAINLKAQSNGETLPELVDSIETILNESPKALLKFNNLLMRAKYIRPDSGKYINKYVTDSVRYYSVRKGFPRISRDMLCEQVISCSYELDINSIPDDYSTSAVSVIAKIKEKLIES
jgi:hypothetical protein